MSGQDLMLELQEQKDLLRVALKESGKRGETHAQAEHDYRVALGKQIAIERTKGTPVTIISDVCRGDPVVAKLKFQRDVAEVVYKSAMEAINVYKLNIKTLENQIDREYRG